MIYYRPDVLGRYIGIVRHYEQGKGFYWSLGLWWFEIEQKKHF